MNDDQPGLEQPSLGHLSLDALADALVAEAEDADALEHLAGCDGCAARLAELREAVPLVTAALSGLPAVPVSTDVAGRLERAVDDARASGDPAELRPDELVPDELAPITTLPAPRARRGPPRWLSAAAGLAVVLAGVGVALSVAQPDQVSDQTAAADSFVADRDLLRNETGNDYAGRDDLAAALPGLLGQPQAEALTAPAPAGAPAPVPPMTLAPGDDGGAGAGSAVDGGGTGAVAGGTGGAADLQAEARQGGPDPLARLRDDPGLTECLRALLPPEDPSVKPLAIDYARYRGTPAMVVVLPSAAPDRLDVFVVGSGCSAADDSTLFYASVPAP